MPVLSSCNLNSNILSMMLRIEVVFERRDFLQISLNFSWDPSVRTYEVVAWSLKKVETEE